MATPASSARCRLAVTVATVGRRATEIHRQLAALLLSNIIVIISSCSSNRHVQDDDERNVEDD